MAIACGRSASKLGSRSSTRRFRRIGRSRLSQSPNSQPPTISRASRRALYVTSAEAARLAARFAARSERRLRPLERDLLPQRGQVVGQQDPEDGVEFHLRRRAQGALHLAAVADDRDLLARPDEVVIDLHVLLPVETDQAER